MTQFIFSNSSNEGGGPSPSQLARSSSWPQGQATADSVEKSRFRKLRPIDTPKLAAKVSFHKLERIKFSEIELSRALRSEISTCISDVGVFNRIGRILPLALGLIWLVI